MMHSFPNRIRDQWDKGLPVLNGWLSMPGMLSAEVMSRQGFQSLTIDMQHGLIGHEAMIGQLGVIDAARVAPMVRVPSRRSDLIASALDSGAIGIIGPLINTAAQAQDFAAELRYPPIGARSFGPTRAGFVYGAAYADEANESVVGLAMIETAEAVGNLDDILKVPGLDGVYIGPADLTLNLSGPSLRRGFDREEPQMIATIQDILCAAHAEGKKAGLHCGSAAYALRAIEWGFDLVTLSNDLRLLSGAASRIVEDVVQGSQQRFASGAQSQTEKGY